MASRKHTPSPSTASVTCPLCMDPALMALADRLVCNGLDDVGVAEQCGVTRDQLHHHLEVCGIRVARRDALGLVHQPQDPAELAQTAPGEPLDGQAIIDRLNTYLLRVEAIIEAGEPSDIRGTLLALDQARKTCETMARLYLDVMQAQLDLTVQAEFRRIVMEAINATAPEVRQRIIAEIQSRASVFGVIEGQ